MSDILDAEARLAEAQQQLRKFSDSTTGMRQTIDKEGRRGVVIEAHRYDEIEHLRSRVEVARGELMAAKREWLAGLVDD
jgi:hypothetical protein